MTCDSGTPGGRGNSTESPRTTKDELELPALRQLQPKQHLTRRHSSQVESASVHPINEESGDGGEASSGLRGKPIPSLRRSSTVRTPAGHSRALQLGKTSGSAGSGPTNSPLSSNSATTTNGGIETSYEEMIVRFQIRQLQHSASGMTVCSEDRRVSMDPSRVPDTKGGESDRCIAGGHASLNGSMQHQGHLSPESRRSSYRGSEGFSGATTQDGGAPEPMTLRGRAGDGMSYGTSLGESYPPMSRPTSMHTNNYSVMEYDHGNEDGVGPARSGKLWLAILVILVPAQLTLRRWVRWAVAPFSPFSVFSQIRYAVSMLAAMAFVVCFPMELTYPEEKVFQDIDMTIGVVLILDVLASLNTGYVLRSGAVANSRRLIVWNYVSNRFWLDVLASLPMPLLDSGSGQKHSALRIGLYLLLDVVRMERLVHMMQSVRKIWLLRANQVGSGNNFWAWLLYSRYSHLLRIASIVTMLLVIAHYIACIWTMLLAAASPEDEESLPWRESYSSSFYSALLLLQGEGVEATTAGQNLFGSFSVLVGSIVLAVVFGHVAILVSNFNANFTNYQRKMEAVFAMTAKLQLPLLLCERIHEYYEHLWHEYECLDGEIVHFAKELSHTLGLEVVLFKYMELVMNVPFWKDCTPDFQKQLMLRLDVRVYLPDDFIMRQGEVDDEFYMVNRGYCELSRESQYYERVTDSTPVPGRTASKSSYGGPTSRRRYSGMTTVRPEADIRQSAYELDAAQRQYYSSRGKDRIRSLELMITRGQAFGDLALVMNYQRAANVRAITHVEMCVLSREDFQAVLTRYPEDRRRVIVDLLASYMHSYEASQSRCPLLELVRSVYSPEAIAAACAATGAMCPPPTRVMSAREAAECIYTAINVDLQDPSIKFGVGADVRQQLVELRDRRRRKRELQRQQEQETQHEDQQRQWQSQSQRDADIQSLSAPSSARTSACLSRKNSDKASEEPQPKCMGSWHHPGPLHDVAPQAQTPVQAAPRPLTWEERLRRAEEREVVIQRALRDLQASMRQLEAKRAAEAAAASTALAQAAETAAKASTKRKRVAPEKDQPVAVATTPPLHWKMLQRRSSSTLGLMTPAVERGSDAGGGASAKIMESPVASPPSRPPLLKRMGSLVGLSPGVPEAKDPTESPTRYADQLFQPQRQHGAQQPLDNRTQLSRHVRSPSAIDNSAATVNPGVSSALAAASSHAATTVANATGQPHATVEKAPTGASQDRRKLLHRNHSQSLRALAEAVAPLGDHFASRHGNTSSTPDLLRRMSSFMADAHGHQQHESPTRYADELFQARLPQRRGHGGQDGQDPREVAEAATEATATMRPGK